MISGPLRGRLRSGSTCSIRLQEGMRGFYRGWTANTLKVVPQNSIRFVSYELFKSLLNIQKQRTDT